MPLPLEFPSMGKCHLHVFPIDYMCVQGYLVLDVFFLLMCLPVGF